MRSKITQLLPSYLIRLGPLAGAVVFILHPLLWRHLNPEHNTISEYVYGRWGFLQEMEFILFALSLLSAFYYCRRIPIYARSLLALASIGIFSLVLFPTPRSLNHYTAYAGDIHDSITYVSSTLLILCLLTCALLERDRKWHLLACLAAFVSAMFAIYGPFEYVGIAERTMFSSVGLWLLWIGHREKPGQYSGLDSFP